MFTSIPSLDPVLQCLLPAFTQPSFQTHVEVFLGWVMCLGKRTEYGVFQTVCADTPISRKRRHPFDRFYNFFSRSAWTVGGLAQQVAVAIVARLTPRGRLYLLQDILAWFPDRKLVFVGDGAYSAKNLLGELDSRVTYVGVMRSDAAIYDPLPPKQSKSKRGPKAQKGSRLPNPKEAMKKADRNRNGRGPWLWQTVEAAAYGVTRQLEVVSFQAVWPKVMGLVPILVVLIRDPEGRFKDKYLFTTDLNADLGWVISTFARRWSIEVAFKSSKQVMQIQTPQHWCRQSIEKLSPWVWLMQSVISLWYITDGRKLPQARAARRSFGKWDTEWSLEHMLCVLRAEILEAKIRPKSPSKADLYRLLDQLENYLHLAA